MEQLGVSTRSQAGMEYLIVYGIAFLIIIVAVFYLYTILQNPASKIPNSCTFSGGATCSDLVLPVNSVTGNTAIVVLLGNSGDTPITNPLARAQINGVNSSWFKCLPNYAKAGGSIVCQMNLTQKPGAGQVLSGKIYLQETNCALSATQTCQITANQVYVGSFEGSTAKQAIGSYSAYTAFPYFDNLVYTINDVGTSSDAQPLAIAINPKIPYAYITDEQDNNVMVINTNNYEVVNTLYLPSSRGIAINGSGNPLYIADSSTDLYEINTSKNTIENSLSLGNGPALSLAVSPSGSPLYALESGEVNVIDTIPPVFASINMINLGTSGVCGQEGIAFDPANVLEVYNTGGVTGNFVDVINVATNSIVNTISLNGFTCSVAFTPSGSEAFVTDGNGIGIINPQTNLLTTTIALPSSPYSISINPSGTLAYAYGFEFSNTISVINIATSSLLPSFTLPSNSFQTDWYDMAFTYPSGSLAFVTNRGQPFNTVYVVAPGSLSIPQNQRYPLTFGFKLNGQPIEGITVNFSTTNSLISLSPRYENTNAIGQVTTYIIASAPVIATIYANLTNTISSNVLVGFT